jgi:hypothetical protein
MVEAQQQNRNTNYLSDSRTFRSCNYKIIVEPTGQFWRILATILTVMVHADILNQPPLQEASRLCCPIETTVAMSCSYVAEYIVSAPAPALMQLNVFINISLI